MKKHILLLSFIIPIIFAVSCNEHSGVIPTFNYTTDYPVKEFPYEENFNIKYIPIETDSIMVNRCRVIYSSTNLTIALTGKDYKFIFINDDGKIIKSFSRLGNAPGEYTSITDVFYDAINKEFFILDSRKGEILILDNDGVYKNAYTVNKEHNIASIMDFNSHSFISYNNLFGFSDKENKYGSYSIISKKDGAIIKNIIINPTEKEKRYPTVIHLPNYIAVFKMSNLIPNKDFAILDEAYCDTIYKINRTNYTMEPYYIKSPAFNTFPQNDKYFLETCMDTPNYTVFFKLNVKYDDSKANLIQEEFFYDKREQKFYKSGNKYINNQKVGPFDEQNYNNYGLFGYSIDIIDLFKMDEQGILGAPLKSILSKANENDNPVLVLMSLKEK
ncbi:MAG: 6-bladed beta-propeller [Bacteroidales bacterium]